MKKKELISRIASVLRDNNIRKPISIPKQTFHISDDDGNCKDFTVKKTNKTVQYNTDDVSVIIDACLSVIEDALKHGEDVNIHGFGTLSVCKRAARQTKHPDTGEVVEVRARYVPKFSFGNTLRIAANVYELSLKDFDAIAIPSPDNNGEDFEDGDVDGD